MKSLSELADIYEEWAKADESTAKRILADFTSSAAEVDQAQRDHADWLTAEATALRDKASELRKMEAAIDGLCGLISIKPAP